MLFSVISPGDGELPGLELRKARRYSGHGRQGKRSRAAVRHRL